MSTLEKIIEDWPTDQFRQSCNLAPTQSVPVVLPGLDVGIRCGLVLLWTAKVHIYATFNAGIDSLSQINNSEDGVSKKWSQ